jgi:hypothetical protein
MLTDYLQRKQKDFKMFALYTDRSRSVPSAIDINTLNIDITKSKMVCGQCPLYKNATSFLMYLHNTSSAKS